MIEIFCEGGLVFFDIDMSYNIMCHLMEDDVIPERGFLEVKFLDGARGKVRKDCIIGFCESKGNTQV